MAKTRTSTSRAAARRPSPAALERTIAAMRRAVANGRPASVTEIANRDRDPFRILISTILSLRTKDEVTDAASARLFALASTPRSLAGLDPRTIARAIYPVGFYRTKARTVRDISRRIDDEFSGRVPDTIDALLDFKGVGRKTAALVVSLGYGTEAICVDTHVHRISNRLGWIATRTPVDTERDLMVVLPRRHWIGVNETMVSFGQRVCTPLSPHCSTCPVGDRCPRVGVGRHR
jgi:endonuclease-3